MMFCHLLVSVVQGQKHNSSRILVCQVLKNSEEFVIFSRHFSGNSECVMLFSRCYSELCSNVLFTVMVAVGAQIYW